MTLVGVRLASRLVILCGLLLASSAHGRGREENASLATTGQGLQIALVGDPQIGYGPGGIWGDGRRFRIVVDALNQAPVDLVLIAGDLVQDRTLSERWIFERELKRLKKRVILVPGNHDVVDTESLLAYRTRFGSDHQATLVDGVLILAVNSETARDERTFPEDYAQEWSFIEDSLAKYAVRSREILLLTHRPPFIKQEQESAHDGNWPERERARLLSLCRKYQIRWIFAGHLHSTHRTKTEDGIVIEVAAGSARSFDHSPIGYHAVSFTEQGASSHLVSLAPGPAPPFSVPGLRGWTPRLFDYSPRHWVFTGLFLTVAILSFRVARRSARRQEPQGAEDEQNHQAWRGMGVALSFFGINYQLDFDELLREIGRIVAKLTGVHEFRHLITGGALAFGLSLAFIYLVRSARRSRTREIAAAGAALLVPASWFVLSTISHHDLEMLMDEPIWDGLVLVSLGVIAWTAHSAGAARSDPI